MTFAVEPPRAWLLIRLTSICVLLYALLHYLPPNEMSNKNDEALASPDAIVQGKHWRLTVLTPGLVRVEHSPDGRFEDRASTFAINRSLLFPRFTAFRTDRGGVELVTANLRLTYDGKPFSPHGLRVEGLFARTSTAVPLSWPAVPRHAANDLFSNHRERA